MIYQISPKGTYKQYSELPKQVIGDIVQIERNGIYNHLKPTQSGVKFEAYGVGEDPIFSSLIKASKWIQIEGTKLWKYSNSSLNASLKVLLLNGEIKRKGFSKMLYPIVKDSIDNSFIETKDLNLNLTGSEAKIVIIKQDFIIDTYNVKSNTTASINYEKVGTNQYLPKSGYGFFIQNHISCLNEFGDWMYEAKTKTVTMFFGDLNPNDFDIQMPNQYTNLTIDGVKNIEFYNLNFSGSNGNNVEIKNSTDLKFINCNAHYSGGHLFNIPGLSESNTFSANNISWNNCNLSYGLNGGIYAGFYNHNLSATFCTFKNIFPYQGGAEIDGNGDAKGNALTFERGNNNLIANNKFLDSGFNAIVANGNGCKISSNLIDGFGLNKGDCAGIYMGGGKENISLTSTAIIKENVILNGFGITEGTDKKEPISFGIYFDDQFNNGACFLNFISDCKRAGIYIHNAYNLKVVENTSIGNHIQLQLVQDFGNKISDLHVTNNNFECSNSEQTLVHVGASPEELKLFGIFQDNKYKAFNLGTPMFTVFDGNYSNTYLASKTWDQWKSYVGESGSELSFHTLPEFTKNFLWDQDAFNGGSGTMSSSGDWSVSNSVLTLNNLSGQRKALYMNAGLLDSGKTYMIEGNTIGSCAGYSTEFEKNFYKFQDIKAIGINDNYFYSIMTLKGDSQIRGQIMLLMDSDVESLGFSYLKLSELVEYQIPSIEVVIPEIEAGYTKPIIEEIKPFELKLEPAPEGYQYIIKLVKI